MMHFRGVIWLLDEAICRGKLAWRRGYLQGKSEFGLMHSGGDICLRHEALGKLDFEMMHSGGILEGIYGKDMRHSRRSL